MKFKFYALWLSAICILVFVMQLMITNFTNWFVLDSNSFFEPWRFITSIFLHGGLAHLIYNLFALALFGSLLEGMIGGKKFLTVFIVSGVVANLIAVNFYSSSLGASGAIFGVIGALVIIRPTLPVWAFGIPMPIFVAGILWGIGDIIGAVAFVLGNPIDNTGNIAHLSGMFVGFILGFIFRRNNSNDNPNQRIRYSLNEKEIRNWEDNYLK